MADLEDFVMLVKSLTMDKKAVLHEMGFEFVLQFDSMVVRKTMCRWVVDHFDPHTRMLEAYGDKVELIPRHVEYLLGFKDNGFEIENDVKSDPSTISEDVVRLIELDTKSMAAELRGLSHEDPNFKRLFTLFLLTAICSPTVDKKPRREWLYLVVNVETIGHWNYARLVFQETVAAIEDFKSQSPPTILGGCPLFLMVSIAFFIPFNTMRILYWFCILGASFNMVCSCVWKLV